MDKCPQCGFEPDPVVEQIESVKRSCAEMQVRVLPGDLLRVEGVMALMGISSSTFYRWRDSGLRTTPRRGRCYVSINDLAKFMLSEK